MRRESNKYRTTYQKRLHEVFQCLCVLMNSGEFRRPSMESSPKIQLRARSERTTRMSRREDHKTIREESTKISAFVCARRKRATRRRSMESIVATSASSKIIGGTKVCHKQSDRIGKRADVEAQVPKDPRIAAINNRSFQYRSKIIAPISG